jgi:sulfate adenylyltransferase subunit 2
MQKTEENLDELEAKSIYIIRESYRKFGNKLAASVSWGKDSVTMLHLVRKAFFGNVTIPIIHIDTSYKFKEIYEFRDRLIKEWNLKLLIAKNEDALGRGVKPEKGRFECCLPPREKILTNNKVKQIQKVKVDEEVFTHKGRTKKVTKTFVRDYKGFLIEITPVSFLPFSITPEHPILALKNEKCVYSHGTYTRPCTHTCPEKYRWQRCKELGEKYLNYTSSWIKAKDLKIGDFLAYPFIYDEEDIKQIDLSNYIRKNNIKLTKEWIYSCNYPKGKRIPRTVKIDEFLLELLGYYVAEGWSSHGTNFSFNENEIDLTNRVKFLIKKIFKLEMSKDIIREGSRWIKADSILLEELFLTWFGSSANEKRLPLWLLRLPSKKLLPFLKGYIFGDGNIEENLVRISTSSQHLAEFLKIIFLRLGIIPNIRVTINDRGVIKGRKIIGGESFLFHIQSKEDLNFLKRTIFPKLKVNLKKQRKRGFILGSYVYIPIRKIRKKPYSGKVFNLEIEKDNSYLTAGASLHNCTELKTEALKKGIEKFGIKALLLAIRRDEHGIRAKERVFSLRNQNFEWNLLNQLPELWEQFNEVDEESMHVRIHPMLHWREIDIWKYIRREGIPIIPLYFSGFKKKGFRFRSIGCETCCVPIPSDAKTIDEIVAELEKTRIAERSGRSQDKEKAYMMQKLRVLGYM